MTYGSTNKISPASSQPPPPSASSSSSSSVDSYIGSFISLTSKCEIRYEGVLYYLSPQDSTIGLKEVRSYGTEGRNKDGPHIPPCHQVYEYIMFRGSDIKVAGNLLDLQVKSSPPAQQEELIQNDPAIIQSYSLVGPSCSPKSVSAGGESLKQFSSYQKPPALANIAYPGALPSFQSGTPKSPVQATQNANGASLAMSMHWPGYNETSSNIPYASQHPNPLVPVSTITTSSPLTVQNRLQPSATLACTTMGLTISSFPASCQHIDATEAPIVGKPRSDSVTALSVQALPCSAPSVADSTLVSLFKLPQKLLTPSQLVQPRPPLLISTQNPYPAQKDMLSLNSASSNLSSSITTAAVQAPLLPSPHSAQQFTEEFDFDAMNEKFRKDEARSYLGGLKQRDKAEGIEDNAVGQSLGHEESCGSAPRLDSKPAYNKDEFFDTLSCNSLSRVRMNGQNRFSERMKLDNETFGTSRQRLHVGYGAGRGENYRGLYNWGREYNSIGRSRGGNFTYGI
ncbi:hypothetical protein U1Q18_018948 [Sarracenia purpurea var. burkii]